MSHDGKNSGFRSSDLNSKIMIAAVTVLFAVVLFVFLLHLYARWFWRHSARVSRRRHRSLMRRRFYFAEEVDPARLSTGVGLDSKVLEALPMFVYKAQNYAEGMECAVCLSEFEENEKGRVLPKCKHSFHIGCIDMWFHSHSTCPICRASAQADDTEETSTNLAKIEEVSGSEAGLNLELGQTSSEEQGPSCRRAKPQIVIDIPKRTDNFPSPRGEMGQVFSSPNGSSKSPACHLRSLSRMLSRDKDRDRERKVFPDVETADGST